MTTPLPRHLGLLLALMLSLAAPALGSPLSAWGDHTGENHSGDKHDNETLNDIILTSATLIGIDLKKSVLTNAVAMSANFTSATLDDSDFRSADLTAAVLTGASLKRADFSGAVFDGADLSTADVNGTVFSGASFLGANLSGLGKADKADFTGAFYNAATILDPKIDTSVMVFVPEASAGVTSLMAALACARRRRPAPTA